MDVVIFTTNVTGEHVPEDFNNHDDIPDTAPATTSPAQHVEHFVSSNSQEGGSHPLDVSRVDSTKPDQHLSLAHNLIGPGLLVEVGPKAVGHSVGGHLVAISVQVLHLGIVGPFVGDVEGSLHGASIGVVSVLEEILIELLVEIIDGIIKGQEDKLGNLIWRISSWNVSSSTVAVLQ